MNQTLGSMFRQGLSYSILNFATPIVFFLAFQYYGPKPAIAFALVASLFQFFAHRFSRKALSPFFILSSGFVLVFGSIDLFLQSPQVFRLEPFVQNFSVATAITATTVAGVPLFRYWVEALPQWLRPILDSETEAYLRQLSWVWVVYLYVKAGVFLYLAYHVDLGTLVVLRSFLGGGSLALLVLSEYAYRRYFWRKEA